MAIVEMEHLTIMGHQSEMPALIHHLSQTGLLEIERDPELESSLAEEMEQPHAFRREIPGLDFSTAFQTRMAQLSDPYAYSEGLLSGAMTDYPRYIAEATRLIDFLDQEVDYCEELKPRKKGRFAQKREVAYEDYQSLAPRQAEILAYAHQLESLKVELAQLGEEEHELKQELARIEPWIEFNLPVALWEQDHDAAPTDPNFIRLLAGTLAKEKVLDEIDGAIRAEGHEAYSYEILGKKGDLPVVLVAAHHDEAEAVFKHFLDRGLDQPPALAEEYRGDYRRAYAEIESRLGTIGEQYDAIHDEALILAEARPTFELLSDFYRMQRTRMEGMAKLAQTPNLFVVTAWCPKKEADHVIRELDENFSLAISRRDPVEGEEVPTLMRNNAWASPFEELVQMFSPPRYGVDVDPSAFVAPLYSFFFGIMLSDIGYGLLMMGITAFLIWGAKVQGSMRKLSLVLFNGGAMSIFWGVMFGSFFGNLPSVLTNGAVELQPVWFDPMDEPLKLMIWSMIFGVIHLFIGMALRMRRYFRDGQPYEAMTLVFPWYLIIGGLGLMIAQVSWAKYLAIAGVAIVLFLSPGESRNPFKRFFSNLLKLYDITSYLGDVLSYTRILALTLATAVIALVVNILVDLVGLSFPSVIFSVLILIFGHALNLALSGLSAYVHAIRLHYVEFFGQFYEGAGRSFEPFKLETKYTEPTAGLAPQVSGPVPRSRRVREQQEDALEAVATRAQAVGAVGAVGAVSALGAGGAALAAERVH